MAEPLSFEALASSEYVLSSAENFVLYVLLEAVARGAGGGGRVPLNLGVVIDRSGSMYDERRLEFVDRGGQVPGRQPDAPTTRSRSSRSPTRRR